ncbi:DgyrCDS9681 [Dimorphilus gyrociliatus]|uniref:DgyrCDS9681 n=1 Tax=Dimorphilus gyrociliatus TaxID=2664684 RepID=A0A7I8VY38_9ANNE|nr:DgyrCDS9681 [Dimorphilus gyrociliatus]
MEIKTSFHWADYLLFIGTLLISLGIGIYYAIAGGKQKTTKEYLMGNKSLGVIPVALSMFMSYISAILILGNTAEMYLHGTQMWMAAVGSSLAFAISSVIFVPLFYPLNITSSFQYLEMRFKSRSVRLSGTILLMLSQILYMGIAMFSPATALDAVTNIPVWASILATGVVATIYTTLGGMKAVVWTDVFQALVMVGGLITVLVMGTNKIDGGMKEVFKRASDTGRIKFFNMNANPLIRMSFWSVVVGRVIASVQTTGTGQTSVQRYCSVSSMNKGRISVILNTPAMLLFYTLTCLCGLVVFAYFDALGCDPLRAGVNNSTILNNQNQLLPFFISQVINVKGLSGLFVAVLFSGALSTLSSSLNSLAAVTWKDLLEWKFHHIPEERKALANKLLVGVFGIIAVGMAFMAQTLGGHVLQASQSFVSGVAGPLLGMFLLGGLIPFANWKGALAGGWIGLILTLTVTIGQYVTKPHSARLSTSMNNCSDLNLVELKGVPGDKDGVFGLFRISFMWFSAIGTFSCLIIGTIVSLLTGPEKPSEQDPRLIIPFFQRVFCCLPMSIQRKLWCGVDRDKIIENDFEEEFETVEMKGNSSRNAIHPMDNKVNGHENPAFQADEPKKEDVTKST